MIIHCDGISLSGSGEGSEDSAQYSVGDRGPAGGRVFYDRGWYSGGWRYLESAPPGWNSGNADPSRPWLCSGSSSDTLTDKGSGASNTEAISASCSDPGSAVFACASLCLGGYCDWFLPSLDELDLMMNELAALPEENVSQGYYWSSSGYNADSAWAVSSSTGVSVQFSKSMQYYLRPARAF